MSDVDLRRASPDDVAAIVELNRVGSGDGIAAEMDVVFRCGGMAGPDYAVAVDDGKVVAAVGLLSTQLRVGSVTLPVGQPEYVATDPAYRGQGVAGRLLELVQDWSEARHDLVQIIAGVPYFYRQYGYSYGLARPRQLAVPPEQALAMPAGWEVRAAELGDIERIQALQADVQAQVDVALPLADNLWPGFVEMPTAAPLLVATRAGRVEAVARLRVAAGFPVHVQCVAAPKEYAVSGVQAVMAAARARYPGATLIVAEREAVAMRAVVAPCAVPLAGRRWIYVRVPSLVALLSELRPVLDQRLARSVFAAENGELIISLYRSGVRLEIEHGRVAAVSAAAAVHEPDEEGLVGVPPDMVPLLLFGEGGAVALEEHPDVFLGRFRPLMAALFPPLRLDLLTW